MTTSSITVTALTATATLRGNKLAAAILATGPAANLPNLQIDVVEFYASATNDFTTAALVVSGYPEALHAGLIEERTYYYWARVKARNGSYGAVFPASPTAGVACKAIGMSGLAFGLANGKLVASVAANALTIAVKTAAGADPSASDPVYLAFRDATLATGSYQVRTIEAALSLTVSNGSTLSTTDSNPFRLWVALFDDAATLRLAAQNCLAGNNLYPLQEDGLASATAEGGAGAADQAGVFYAAAAIASKPFRLLGYLEWTSGLATAGAWSSGPDAIQMFSVGSKKPGDIVQEVVKVVTGNGSGSTTLPFDESEPQISEGILFTSQAFTPKSKMNRMQVEAMLHCSHSVATQVVLAIFQNLSSSPTANTNAIASGWGDVRATDIPTTLHARASLLTLTTSELVFQFRGGGSAAGTFYYNRNGAMSFPLITTLVSRIAIRELMG